MDACATGELGFKLFFKLRRLDPESFEQGTGKTFELLKQGQQKVFVGNFGVIAFRGQID
jgi:hypothetical protein